MTAPWSCISPTSPGEQPTPDGTKADGAGRPASSCAPQRSQSRDRNWAATMFATRRLFGTVDGSTRFQDVTMAGNGGHYPSKNLGRATWFKLERQGDTFISSLSTNGTDWTVAIRRSSTRCRRCFTSACSPTPRRRTIPSPSRRLRSGDSYRQACAGRVPVSGPFSHALPVAVHPGSAVPQFGGSARGLVRTTGAGRGERHPDRAHAGCERCAAAG